MKVNVPKGDITVPIVVALIALLGAMLPILVNNLFFQQKNPQIFSYFYKSNNTLGLYISNNGTAPANNFSVVLDSRPNKIVNLVNDFSSVDLYLKGNGTQLKQGVPIFVNGTYIKLNTPRLVQGTGSFIRLGFPGFEGQIQIPAYALYDQGSTELGGDFPGIPQQGYFYPLIGFYVVLIGSYPFVWIYFRKRRRRKIISKLLNELINIRRKVSSNLTTSEVLEISRTVETDEQIKRYVREMGDYIKVDDALNALDIRNREANPLNKIELNIHCLSLINKALSVEWEKYI